MYCRDNTLCVQNSKVSIQFIEIRKRKFYGSLCCIAFILLKHAVKLLCIVYVCKAQSLLISSHALAQAASCLNYGPHQLCDE